VLEHLNEALDVYTDAATDFEAHLKEVMTPIEVAIGELPQRHSDLWEVFRSVRGKDDHEAMERYLSPVVERQQFYERLTAYMKTLRLALASVTFHEKTDGALIARYRSDLKYFMQLRASVARRYAEMVDFKQYHIPIQKLLDMYVGAGEVETLVHPVSILDQEHFAEEIDKIGSLEGKAETIANRVRRTIHEHLEEDPVFYKRFSELIDETLCDARALRIDQLELLHRMEDIRDRVRDRRATEDVPEILRSRDVAKTYYDVVVDQLRNVSLSLPEEAAAELALRIDGIILTQRKVAWTEDPDRQNQMKIAIEDELFALKARYGLELDFDTIDRLLDRLIDVARRRVP